MKTRFQILFVFFAIILCRSQDQDSIKRNPLLFSASAEYGSILPTNVQLTYYDNLRYAGYSAQVLKQTTGKKDWEKLFNYPQYGIGVYGFDFLDNKKMGSPFAVYAIYSSKIKEWNKLKWYYSANLGISFNSNPFDYDAAYYNTSVGSKTNMYISLGTGLYYEIGKHFDVGLNLKFNHLSNGAMKIPNKGLNAVAPQVSLVYYPERVNPVKDENIASKIKKYNTWEVSVFGGKKNVFYRGDNRDDIRLYDGFDYSVYGAEAFYMRQYSAKSAYGLGLGVTKDEQYNHTMYVQDSVLYQKKRFSKDHVLLSVIPTYRLMIDRLYINVGLGYYVTKKNRKYDNSALFQRLSLQYQITDRFFASFGINAYDLHVANYLEWKLGYTFKKKEIK